MIKTNSNLAVLVVVSLMVGCLVSSCGSPSSAETAFSNSSLKGSYALSFAVAVGGGSAVDFTGGTGIIVADGNGNLSGSESYSDTNGLVCSNLTIAGTYTINSNGSGVATFSFTSSDPQCSGSLTQTLAIAEGGKLVKTTNVNANVAQISGDWVRQ